MNYGFQARYTGISEGAVNGGTLRLINSGTGTMKVTGGTDRSSSGIRRGASGGSFEFINSGGGTAAITGGSYTYSHGIDGFTNGSTVLIENAGMGSFTLAGGKIAAGIVTLAGSGTQSTIVNRDGGIFIIKGGIGSTAVTCSSGISRMAMDEGSTAVIRNAEGSLMIIRGSENVESYGINRIGYYSGKGMIVNEAGASMKISGTAASAGIRMFRDQNGNGTLVNAGTLWLNDTAFGTMGGDSPDGSKPFVNEAGGHVKAAVGAMFTGAALSETVKTKTLAVRVLLEDGTATSIDYEMTGTDRGLTGSAAVKSDWLDSAFFADGSTVTFTDLTEGETGTEELREKFRDAFGAGVTVKFKKPFDEKGLDADGTRAILAVNPGAVFYDTDLDAEGERFVAEGSVGFRTITGASGIRVADGGRLTLIGNGTSVADTQLSVASGGTLVLGTSSSAVTETQGGSLKSLASAGTVSLRAGDFSLGSFRNTGSAVSEAGTVLTLAGEGPSDVGRYVNRGVVRIAGAVTGGTLTQERGRLEVASGSAAHFESLSGTGTIDNQGTLVADSGTVTGNVTSNGLTVIESYRGGITSTFAASGGTVMADTFQAAGVVRAGGRCDARDRPRGERSLSPRSS